MLKTKVIHYILIMSFGFVWLSGCGPTDNTSDTNGVAGKIIRGALRIVKPFLPTTLPAIAVELIDNITGDTSPSQKLGKSDSVGRDMTPGGWAGPDVKDMGGDTTAVALTRDVDIKTYTNKSESSQRKNVQKYQLFVSVADFDGDGKVDSMIWRPGHEYNIRNVGTFNYGDPGDIPVMADFNNKGKAVVSIFRPSNGHFYSMDGLDRAFGQAGDLPIVGDYLGKGKPQLAVYRPSNSTFYIEGEQPIPFGNPGDMPVPCDYSGRGRVEIALYRPSNATFYIRHWDGQVEALPYGDPGDVPIMGDFDGDAACDIAIYRPSNSTFYTRNKHMITKTRPFGDPGDIPVVGDYNGDGIDDIAVYRRSNAKFYVEGITSYQYGDPGDWPGNLVPIP